jgi:adenine-specific DNA methylase
MRRISYNQTEIFSPSISARFPSTRYQGSKAKLASWIWNRIKELDFDTALDAFGGTGAVSYIMKKNGKRVSYNDKLKFNFYIGSALIENGNWLLNDSDIDLLLSSHRKLEYSDFITRTFRGIYYYDDENRWLDKVVQNILLLENKYKKALAYYALFQSCIIKRPFNLFHRRNLYIREADVKRNFGNKTTWDGDFGVFFRKFANEANKAVFSNGRRNLALNMDVFDLEVDVDLVYVDTPYLSKKGVGVDYLEFYHFLEGLTDYHNWQQRIDFLSKNRKIKHPRPVWSDPQKIHTAFQTLFKKFQASTIVVSYRTDGIPSVEELGRMLESLKSEVRVFHRSGYQYVLSPKRITEALIVAK